MNKAFKRNRCVSRDSLTDRSSFREHLVELWQDLQDDPHWKYEELSPIQLLEQLQLHTHSIDNDGELSRANWFWARRPRLLSAISCAVWMIVALGLPFWLFIVPSVGVPFLIISATIIDTHILQSVRWRRQYEASIDRLIRTCTNGV
jgi:hypothetical protein